MQLADQLLANPLLVALLAAALTLVLASLRGVGPRLARRLAAVRTLVWPVLDPVARRHGRPLLADKTAADAEYIATVDGGLLALLQVLWAFGFRWNPISTLKYRVVDGQRQYAMSVVYRSSVAADSQQDVHLFVRDDGRIDIYGHFEPSVTDPTDHVGGDQQVPGDPNRIVRRALAAGGVAFATGER